MVLTALFSPILIGASIIAVLFPVQRLRGAWLVLTLSLGTCLGLGITSCTTFFWLILIGPPGGWYYAAEMGLTLILSLLAYYRIQVPVGCSHKEFGSDFAQNSESIKWLRNIFLFLILISVGSFLLKSFLQDPHGKWDAVDTWNFRARWMFRGGADWAYAFSLRAMDGLDYPLLLTVSVFRMWQAIGKDLTAVPILIAGIFTFSSYLLLYSSLALLRGSNQGYLAAIFLMLSTQFLNIGTYQYADVPLAFFILGTVFLLCLKDRFPEHAYTLAGLAGLTVACAAWTKNEGQLFLALVIFVYFILRLRIRNWSRTLKEFAGFFFGLTPVLGTLVYFKINFALENTHIRNDLLTQQGSYLIDIDRYVIVGARWFNKIITFNDGIIWLALVYFCLSGIERSGSAENRRLSPIVLMLLMMCGYFMVYVIYPGNPLDLLSASLRRVMIQIWLTWVFIYFYCVRGPEKHAAISSGPNKIDTGDILH